MENEIFILPYHKDFINHFRDSFATEIPGAVVVPFENNKALMQEYRLREREDNLPGMIIHDIERQEYDEPIDPKRMIYVKRGPNTIEDIKGLSPDQKIVVFSPVPSREDLVNLLSKHNIPGLFEKTGFLVHSVVNRMMNPHPTGINILVAPSGFGKSSMIEHFKGSGIPVFPKYTTRPYRSVKEQRSGEIRSISYDEFQKIFKEGNMVGVHQYRGHMYGINRRKLNEIATEDKECVFAFIDPEPAIVIKEMYPSRTNLIAIQPSFEQLKEGLERRINSLLTPSEGYTSMAHEFEDLKRRDMALKETEKRIRVAELEAYKFGQYLDKFDYVIQEKKFDMLAVKAVAYAINATK